MKTVFIDNSCLSFRSMDDQTKVACQKIAPRNYILASVLGADIFVTSVPGVGHYQYMLEPYHQPELKIMCITQQVFYEPWLLEPFIYTLACQGYKKVIPFIGDLCLEEACQRNNLQYLSAPGALAEKYRSKWALYELCRQLGLPTLETKFVQPGSYTAQGDEFAKPDISAGSIGNIRLEKAFRYQFSEPMVIQPRIKMIGSPSVQVEFGGGIWTILGVTDQIFENGEFVGMSYPSVLNVKDQQYLEDLAKGVARYFNSIPNGSMMEGRFSIDFYQEESGEFYVGDLNLRHGGGSIPATAIAQGYAVWVHQNVLWAKDWRSFPWSEQVLPTMPLRDGKMGVMILGSTLLDCQKTWRNILTRYY